MIDAENFSERPSPVLHYTPSFASETSFAGGDRDGNAARESNEGDYMEVQDEDDNDNVSENVSETSTEFLGIDELLRRHTPFASETGEVRICPTSDASSHDFLQWGPGDANSPSWTRNGCVRHSNLVRFSFQRIEADTWDWIAPFFGRCEHFITDTWEIDKLEAYWTGIQPPAQSNQERVLVVLLFRTELSRDWQITRHLFCVVRQRWADVREVPHEVNFLHLYEGVRELHLLSNSVSSLCALYEYSAIACSSVQSTLR